MEKYFAVVYQKPEFKNAMMLLPCDDKEDALSKLRTLRDDPKVGPRIKATTVIKRDMANFKDGLIFGCPKSLNVLLEKPKKEKKHE